MKLANFIVKMSAAMLLCLWGPAVAMGQGRLTGVVTDSSGAPVIGANVVVEGTSNGTTTDSAGQFTLTGVAADASVQVSFIGCVTQVVKVDNRTRLEIVLEEDTALLDDVVVVGYGVQKRANLTGAVSSVNMSEVLGDRPVVSIGDALLGAMPGLQVTGTSGRPGSEYSFNIRGTNSINGGKPLVLVDNVEMDINMLDPNDIESVSVLKDAGSAAIYGARAAFGVILITTKKGSKGSRMSVDYSNNFSFSNAADLPRKATPLQTVQAYKDMGWEGYRTGENVDTWLGLLKEYESNPNLYPEGYAMVDGKRYNLRETDVMRDMLETGFKQTHNVSVSGQTQAVSYRMSAGLVKQDGVLVSDRDSYTRYNVSSYIRSDVSKWITPELDFKYSNASTSMVRSSTNFGVWGAAVAFPSYFPLGEVETTEGMLPIDTPRNMIMLEEPQLSSRNNIRVFGRLTVTPVEGLRIVGEYTFNRRDQETTTYDKIFKYASGNNDFAVQTSKTNSLYKVTDTADNYNALNVYGDYSRTFGRHEFGIMGGFNQERSSYHWKWASRKDMINDNLPSLSGGTGEYENGESHSEYAVRGLFYRLNYSFGGKYLIETNGRYDGSSKFPKGSRFGFFPSVSAGWRVSEESFMEGAKPVLSNLKIRGSYGSIGNQSVDPYQFVPEMSPRQPNWVVGSTRPTTVGSPALVSNSFTWEKVNTLDFGLDLGLLGNRLTAVFDWYRRDTKGMLAPGMELPGVLGAAAPTQNVADLRSKGWELSLDWHDRIGGVDYYIGFNLYDSRTRITKYDNASQLLGAGYYREGMYLGEIWGYVTDRLYTFDDFEADGTTLKEGVPKVEGYNPLPGDVLYVDMDDNGLINAGENTALKPGDRRIIGNNTRRYQYGIRGGVSWKGVSLSFILQGVGKRDVWMMNELYYPQYDQFSTIFASQLDYWRPDNTDSFFPRLHQGTYTDAINANARTQTRYLSNGAYLSIRNITLSWSLPRRWLTPWGCRALSVYFSGENLHTFHHLPRGMNPERTVTEGEGQRGLTYPYMRQYSFGVKIGF